MNRLPGDGIVQPLTDGTLSYETTDADGDNFKVVVRVRPPLLRELQGYRPYEDAVLVHPSNQLITLSERIQSVSSSGTSITPSGIVSATYQFAFDHVFGPESSQEEVYSTSARASVFSTLQGYNAAIIAYGQTGTGKTHTMEGGRNGPERGIIPRAIEDIFKHIETDTTPHSKYLVRASYLQIYNEVISDLLKPERVNLVIREDRRRGVFVDGLSEWVVRSPAEVYGLMERGQEQRTTGPTKLNEMSSRSHAVFIVIVEKSSVLSDYAEANNSEMQQFRGLAPGMARSAPASMQSLGGEVRQCVRVGKLNLVDLAGSERVHITGATGIRLEESKKINQSLSALGNVIGALTDKHGIRPHVPYRDSKLTRILEDSLGGNCRTTMMAMISPSLDAFSETLSTLKFATRAKTIRNAATVNEDVDQRTLLRKYEKELRRLRSELQRRQQELVDKRHLLAVEEEKRRAEADKLAAITALAHRSREFMQEKEAKRKLEQRISSMQSQLLIGGNKIEDTPVFRNLLAREQQRIRSEYEERLRELERERQTVEEDKAQVDRYKGLLLKQRDIMIALTTRLNERDEQILMLQEELEAYDSHQKQLEDALDQRTAEFIALQKAAVEHAVVSPIKLLPLQSALGPWAAGNLRKPTIIATEAPDGQDLITALPQADPGSGRTLDVQSLQPLVQKLSLENSRLREELATAQDKGPALGDSKQVVDLQAQCDSYQKERTALKTIIEEKFGTLVADISRSVSEGQTLAGQHPRLARQIGALQKLLAATVAAMSAQ
eukprot:jgi/Botrbrau1/9118/Bobra.0305s0022.1